MKVVDIKKNEPAQDPNNVLDRAKNNYESLIILGYDNEGVMDVRASLNINAAQILFLIESFKTRLLMGEYADD